MNDFLFLLKSIWRGNSITRSVLDARLKCEFIKGLILDLGAGKKDVYSNLIPKEQDAKFSFLDVKLGATIDFEIDPLPYTEGTFDTVLFFNVLEHLFNYIHILKEIRRIKKHDGQLVGFVPFLMWYHKDPHDFFRYTHESLSRILDECGYKDIIVEPLYKGPYTTALQMVYPTVPIFVRVFLFIFVYPIDALFRRIRPEGAKRYVLGYYFKAK